MHRNLSFGILLLAPGVLAAALGAASVSASSRPSYNVTGAWSGTSKDSKKGSTPTTLTADFTAAGPGYGTFTGTVNAVNPSQNLEISVQGTVSRSGAVKMLGTVTSGGSGTGVFQGKINAKKNIMKGTFRPTGSTGGAHGTFTLTKQ